VRVDWTYSTLGEIAEIVSGATPKTGVKEYWDGDIPWATPKDLSALDSAVIETTPRMLTQAGLKSCGSTLLPVNSLLLSSRAPIGHVAINSVPMATNQGFKSLVPDRRRVDTKFLYWWLRRNRSLLESLGNGATFKEISKKTTSAVPIGLPPIEEQRRIAAILDAADALRAKRRQALAKLDTLTQSIFIDMFGDPVTNPMGWQNPGVEGSLECLTYGHRFYDETYSQEGTRVVRITDLDEAGNLNFDSMPRMSLTDDDRLKYRVRPGDILFARSGATVGKVALIRTGDPECIAGAYFVWMRFTDSVRPEYARAVLTSKPVRAMIARKSRQAAQQNFSGPAIKRLPMPSPPIALQDEFDAAVAGVRTQFEGLNQGMKRLDALFTSLQQRAFRGEL
jgi:type I restriction enzyme, S subunit